MEGNNEHYGNENEVSSEASRGTGANVTEAVASDKNMEVFMQTFLAKIEQIVDKKLAGVSPETNKTAVNTEAVSLNEYTAMKNRLEQLEQTQKSVLHHDLGMGQVSNVAVYDRTKTLEQHVEEYLRNKNRR